MLVIPIFAALICLALGFAWLFSVANVFFRDVEHLLAVLFLPWFFLTPVLYGLDQLPRRQLAPLADRLLRYGNPVTPYVEGVRAVVLAGDRARARRCCSTSSSSARSSRCSASGSCSATRTASPSSSDVSNAARSRPGEIRGRGTRAAVQDPPLAEPLAEGGDRSGASCRARASSGRCATSTSTSRPARPSGSSAERLGQVDAAEADRRDLRADRPARSTSAGGSAR